MFETAIGLGISTAAEIAESIQNFGFADKTSGSFEFLGAKSEVSRDVNLGSKNSGIYNEDDVDDDDYNQRRKRSPCEETTVTPIASRKKRQIPAMDTDNVVPGKSPNPGVGEKDPNVFKRIVDAIIETSERMVKWVQELGSKKLDKKLQ